MNMGINDSVCPMGLKILGPLGCMIKGGKTMERFKYGRGVYKI